MLTDEALAQAAWQQRREALHGNQIAFGKAHELERELRRRAGMFLNSDVAAMAPAPSAYARPWWQFWGERRLGSPLKR